MSRASLARKRAAERARYAWAPIHPGPAETTCETCGGPATIEGLQPADDPHGLSRAWRVSAPCGHRNEPPEWES